MRIEFVPVSRGLRPCQSCNRSIPSGMPSVRFFYSDSAAQGRFHHGCLEREMENVLRQLRNHDES